jgi:single-stranded-DNA-specific exonuclease|tara:strand:- start:17 stop:1735 length:1719 start_codon:yes stop_codon:yes gene_type:complete
MNYVWNLKNPEKEIVQLLSSELKISEFLSAFLVNRNISNLEDADIFLKPTLDKLPNPFLLKDMEKSTSRIIQSIESGEKIIIYGDFDCDGVTSTTILFSFLKAVDANVEFYIPERIEEGYGINLNSIKSLADKGAKLIVTTDCGISESELVERCKDLNLDFIITDHHTVPEIKPNSFSIVNPKQEDCEYPFKEICAAGVVFNFIMALRHKLRDEGYFEFIQEPNLARYLDLVAIGTIADSMPILGVNRIFVQNGLKEIPKTERIGLLAMLKNEKEIYTTRDVSFEIAPKINATGRVGKASNAVKLLIEDDETKIDSLLGIIEQDNKKRRLIQDQVSLEAMVQAESIIKENPEINSLVLYAENWHPGVIGIVASKIVDRFKRPCAVLSIKDEVAKGSLRTSNNINLFEVLKDCKSSLIQFGGHAGAAGITIKTLEINNFKELFKLSIQNYEYDFSEKIDIDFEVSFDKIDNDLLADIKKVEPYGKENSPPIFLTKNTKVVGVKILKEKHLEVVLNSNDINRRAIWFNYNTGILQGQKVESILNKSVNVVYTIQKDTYNGNTNISLMVRDLRVA